MLISHSRWILVTNNFKRISLWATVLSLAGCQTPSISVADISPKKIGRTVYLTGTVVQIAPLIDNAAYQLKDNTGKIWVVTSHNSPQLNQLIKIEGKIEHQSLPFAERELGDFYIVELEQLRPVESKPPDNI